MKILVAHNYYAQWGGEDAVFESEVELLRSKGNDVVTFTRDNGETSKGKASLAIGAVWNLDSYREITRLIDAERPSILHVHNTLPQLSNSIIWAAHRRGIPVVQTLHNFRLLCPQAMFLRDGEVCENCLGKLPVSAIRYGCYRDSRIATLVNALSVTTHRKLSTFDRGVSAFIALSGFSKRKFVEGGIKEGKIHIKPNTISLDLSEDEPSYSERKNGIFVGRLSEEKGVDILVKAMDIGNRIYPIKVVGDGPLREMVIENQRIEYVGYLPQSEVRELIKKSAFVVVPSTCYENFPRVIVEAFSQGVPVIASDFGAMADLVEHGVTGLLFKRGDELSLNETLQFAMSNPEELIDMGKNARKTFLEKYTPDINYAALMAIYRSALDGPILS